MMRTHDLSKILSTPVLTLPGKGRNALMMGDLFDGSICFGSAGSGKTTGFLTYILDAMLKNPLRPGGLIITVKRDDRLRWETLIQESGRGDDLVVISPENDVRVNLIQYEINRSLRQGGEIEYNQIRSLLMECMISAESFEVGTSKSGSDERFWDKQTGLMLIRLMMLLVLAQRPVTIENMRKIMVDSLNDEQVKRYALLWEDVQSEDAARSDAAWAEFLAWRAENAFLTVFDHANSREDLTPEEKETLGLVGDFFMKTWPAISEKTRAIIEASIFGLSEPFLSGILKTHFSQNMSPEALPENCYKKGTILLLDIPIKEYGVSAIYAAAMMKKFFQLTMERRIIAKEENPRPCFLFLDEFHLLVSPKRDYEFQSTCRSTMTATILATQSINNIKAALGGGSDAQVQTKSLLSNLRNQVFCANMCVDTNTYAANLIGKDFIALNSQMADTQDRASFTASESLQYIVPPHHFLTLKSGGSPDFSVDSIMVSRGKDWSTKERFLEVKWDQRRKSQSLFSKLLKFLFR